jgi:lipopolysaccharide/colanic/teichoic acid biosynthesis glycosyltransferase
MADNRGSLVVHQRRFRGEGGVAPGFFARERLVPLFRDSVVQPYRRAGLRAKSPAGEVEGRLMAKRAFDLIGAALALLFALPLFIAIGLAIKLTSRGPVLFRQRRYGIANSEFEIYKFRTMHSHLGDSSGIDQSRPGDPRVTLVGQILRRTSLDELPQLINVIRGDMSLVGPRPHVPGMRAAGMLYEHLVPSYFERHRMRPGITGLAQVNGFRGSTTERHAAIGRIDLDLTYIENWSFLLDARIIVATLLHEFLSGSGD